MIRRSGSYRLASLIAILIALALSAIAGEDDRPKGADRKESDCGPRALYVLMHLEGHEVSYERIKAEIDRLGPGERSLAVLRDAARRFGLELRGVRHQPGDAPDRLMIAFLDRKPHGHFLVLRPVGRSRNFVQIIDPGWGSRVIDAADLSRSGEWSGIALAPVRRDGSVAAFAASGALMVLAIVLTRSRSGNRRPS